MKLFTYALKMEAECSDKTLVPTYQLMEFHLQNFNRTKKH